MNEQYKEIVEALKSRFENQKNVHAFWIGGSIAQGHSDEYSDIDLWLSVDDDKVFSIFADIEATLKKINIIDFKYSLKNNGASGQTLYHLKNMGKFHSVDINTLGLSNTKPFVAEVDDVFIIFDKEDTLGFTVRQQYTPQQIERARKRLQKHYWYMEKCLRKSLIRKRPLEALHYYHKIVQYATKFLRLKYYWSEKQEYDLKHIYRDLPEADTNMLENLYEVQINSLDKKLPTLKKWIDTL